MTIILKQISFKVLYELRIYDEISLELDDEQISPVPLYSKCI